MRSMHKPSQLRDLLFSMPDCALQVEGVGSLSAAQASGSESSQSDELAAVLQRLL